MLVRLARPFLPCPVTVNFSFFFFFLRSSLWFLDRPIEAPLPRSLGPPVGRVRWGSVRHCLACTRLPASPLTRQACSGIPAISMPRPPALCAGMYHSFSQICASPVRASGAGVGGRQVDVDALPGWRVESGKEEETEDGRDRFDGWSSVHCACCPGDWVGHWVGASAMYVG